VNLFKILCNKMGFDYDKFLKHSDVKPGLLPWITRFPAWSVHVGFVVDKVAVGQVFSELFNFSLSVSFHQCSILIYVVNEQ
jgi:hypothetical protein